MPLTNKLLFLNNSGNVGIGTNSPGVTLDVNGAVRTTSGTSNGYRLHVNSGITATDNYMNFYTTQASGWAFSNVDDGTFANIRMIITASGNVGIGTTAPQSKLDIVQAGNSAGGTLMLSGNKTNNTIKYGYLTNSQYASGAETEGTGIIGGTNTSDNNIVQIGGGVDEFNAATFIKFFTAANTTTRTGNERLRIDSAGNIIHYGDSNGYLEVSGADNGYLRIKGANANEKHIDFYHSTTKAFELFLDGSDNLIFRKAVGGLAERMRISSDGNVGIGSNNPTNTKLHIIGDWVGGHSTVKVQGLTDDTVGYGFYNTSGTRLGYIAYTGAGFEWYNNVNVPMLFYTNTAERMRISASGNVGIGTTNPQDKLQVVGAIRFGNNTTYYGTIDHEASVTGANIYNSADTGGHIFQVNGGEKVRITSGGNVGIGATAPSFKLDVAGGDDTNSFRVYGNSTYGPSVRIQFTGTGGKAWNLISNATDNAGGLGALQFWNSTDSVTAMVIKPAGNIGIGTNDPARKLHIHAGSSGATADTSFTQTVIENSGDAGIHIIHPDGSIGRIMFGSPSRQYGALIRWEPTNNNFDFSTDKAGGYLRFLTDNFSERMRITSTGNVGVGITAPAGKLHVSDSVAAGGSADSQLVVQQTLVSSAAALSLRSLFSNTFNTNKEVATLDLGIVTNGSSTPGADIAFKTVSSGTLSERVRITSDGNVGIGTTNPLRKLHVSGEILSTSAAGTDSNLNVATDGVQNTLLGFNNSGSTNAFGALNNFTYVGNGNAYGVQVLSNGSAIATFTSSGNLGIGINGPAARIDAYEALGGTGWTRIISRDANKAAFIGVYRSGSTYSPGIFAHSSTLNAWADLWINAHDDGSGGLGGATANKVVIAGNVGIGTASPQSQLQVGTKTTSTYGDVSTVFSAGVASASGGIARPATFCNTVAPANGNEVQITFTPASDYSATGAIGTLIETISNADSSMRFLTYSAGLTERMRITSGGNVGIGTTNPEGKLDIIGSPINGTQQADWTGAGISYNSFGDVTISRRHGASKDSTYGYTGPIIDFRSSNTVNEWSVAQIMGTVDPQNGTNHQGGLVFLTSSGGTTDPTGRRTQGAAPQARMLISHSGDIFMTGNLGIGTLSSGGRLHLFKGAADVYQTIEADNGYNAYTNYRGYSSGISFGRDGGNGNFRWSSAVDFGGSQLMVLTTSGNLGIGTTDPATRLTITSSGANGLALNQDSSTNSNSARLFLLSSNTNWAIVNVNGTIQFCSGSSVGSDTGTERATLDASGNLSIDGILTESSSITIKENITPIQNALDYVSKLSGVTYDRKDGSAKQRAGLIAEEVEKILPNIVAKDKHDQPSGIQYTNLIAYLVESIKELKAEIEELKKK